MKSSKDILSLSPLFSKRFELIKELGQSSTSIVFHAKDPLQNNSNIFIKVLLSESPDNLALFKKEFSTLSQFNHPSLPTVYDYGKIDNHAYYTGKYFDAVTLEKLISPSSTEKIIFTLEEKLKTIVQLLNVVSYVHSHQSVHGDIKPQNILILNKRILEKKPPWIQLIDLGFTRKETHYSNDASNIVGTPEYMPPETKSHGVMTNQSDIYSLGMLAIELLTCERPENNFSITSNSIYKSPNVTWPKIGISQRIKRTLIQMIHPDPTSRPPSIDYILTDFEDIVSSDKSATTHQQFSHEWTCPYIENSSEFNEINELISYFSKTSARGKTKLDYCGYFIMGPKGSGRSRYLHEIKQLAQTNHLTTVAYTCFPSDSFENIVYQMAHQLCIAIDVALSPDNFNEIYSKLKLHPSPPAILLIDNIDVLSINAIEWLLFLTQKLNESPKPPFFLFFTISDEMQSNAIKELLANTFKHIRIPEFSATEINKLIANLTSRKVPPPFSKYLYDTYGGIPKVVLTGFKFIFRKGFINNDPTKLSLTTNFSKLPLCRSSKELHVAAYNQNNISPELKTILSFVAAFKKPAPLSILYSSFFQFKGFNLDQSELINTPYLKQIVGPNPSITFRDPNDFESFAVYVSEEQKNKIHNAIGLSFLNHTNSNELYFESSVIHLIEAGEILHAYHVLNQSISKLHHRTKPLAIHNMCHHISFHYTQLQKEDQFIFLKIMAKYNESMGQFSDALDALDKALKLSTSKKEIANVIFSKRQLFIKKKDTLSALTLIQNYLSTLDKTKDADLWKETILLLARTLVSDKQITLAQENLSQVKISKLQPESAMHFYYVSARIKIRSKEWMHAIEELQRSLQIAPPFDTLLMSIHNDMGLIYFYYLSDMTLAIDHFRKALAHARHHEDRFTENKILKNIGDGHLRLNNFKDALYYYSLTIQQITNYTNPADRASLHSSIAITYYRSMDLDNALRYTKITRELIGHTDNKQLLGLTLSLEGDIETRKHNYIEALQKHIESRNVFTSCNYQNGVVDALYNIATTYLHLNNTISSVSHAKDALEQARALGYDEMIARCLIVLVKSNLNSNNMGDDETWEWVKALDIISQKLTNKDIFSDNLYLQSRYQLSIGNTSKAMASFNQSIDILESQRPYNPLDQDIKHKIHHRRTEFNQLFLSLEHAPSDEYGNRMRHLFTINAKINSELHIDTLLAMIMDTAIMIMNAERGFLILLENQETKIKASRRMNKTDAEKELTSISSSILSQVIKKQAGIVTYDANSDDRFKEFDSVANFKLKSIIAIPFIVKHRVIGAMYLDNRHSKGSFTKDDLNILGAFGDQAAIAIENARLFQENEKKTSLLIEKNKKIADLNKKLEKKVVIQASELKDTKAILKHQMKRGQLRYNYKNIIGKSKKMIKVLTVLDKVIGSDLTVLICGESGTGKELIARAVHYNSKRQNRAFVSENCAALSETLLESELFGHKKGSFTGAVSDKKGLFELGNFGTVFLDEIGDTSLTMQKKLLRTLQEGTVRRVGDAHTIPVNIRLIAATNRNLPKMIKEGTFRKDLYFRLNVVSITLPPLRERIEDIPMLIEHFISDYCNERDIETFTPTDDLMKWLSSYNWPGNIRELRNEIMRLMVLADGQHLDTDLLQSDIRFDPNLKKSHSQKSDSKALNLATNEADTIREALDECEWNKSLASRQLGITRATLYAKMKKYNLTSP